ncbi:F-box protein-like protein [Tanacetum coccineum]
MLPIKPLQISNPYLYNIQFELQVNNWIRYAVSCNVQDLDLTLTKFVLDQCMFIKLCFTHLKLEYSVINPTGAISWSKLTSLSVFDAYLNEDLIQNILSGCPLLETLELEYCYGFRRIDITSKSVNNFVFLGYEDYEFEDEQIYGIDDVIEINAPYIVSITIADNLWLSILLLVDVSCLVNAHLNYKKCGDYESAHVVSQIMSRQTLMGLMVLSCLEDKGFIFPSNLKVVDVTSPLSYNTYSDSLELENTSHGDISESGDSEGIIEQVLGTCCVHNCGQGKKLASVASTTYAQSQESMALIKSGFSVPASIIPGNVNAGNKEKDEEDENDK